MSLSKLESPIFASIVTVFLFGCAAPMNKNFPLIQRGMTSAEVERLIGKPIIAGSGPEDTKVFYYRLASSFLDTDGSDTRDYYVAMKSGVVIGFGEGRNAAAIAQEIREFNSGQERAPDQVAQRGITTGTGFFVSSNGLVLTNNHVINDAKYIFVTTSSGNRLEAKVVAQSRGTDLALLKVSVISEDYLELVSAESSSIGDDVFTIGYPTTDILGKEAKYSAGAINSLSGIEGDATFMQISVPLQPGNSGGPLVNISGKVVGITTSTAAVAAFLRATGTLPQNVNWAVKADYAAVLSSEIRLSTRSETVDNPITHTKASIVFIEVAR